MSAKRSESSSRHIEKEWVEGERSEEERSFAVEIVEVGNSSDVMSRGNLARLWAVGDCDRRIERKRGAGSESDPKGKDAKGGGKMKRKE